MSSKILNIVQKFRASPVMIASSQDFTWSEGEEVNPQIVIEQANTSLYCLDEENRRVIFVETPAEVDLSQAPFYYQAQFEHASRLIALPYETLHALAQQNPVPEERLILIYSVGRCGSTLLSQIFNLPEDLLSLSEPDVFTQIVTMRQADGSRDPELTELLRSCTALVCKPSPQKKATSWALKFRSFGINLGDIFYRLYPEAKTLFLYRQAESWAQSTARAFINSSSNHHFVPQQALAIMTQMIPSLPVYMARTAGGLTAIELLALVWLSTMQQYLSLHEQGVPLCATRYEDLTQTPEAIIGKLFGHCDLPLPPPAELKRVLARDSQAGSVLSQALTRQQASGLTETQLAQLRQFLSQEPVINTPGFVVPGTLSI